MTTLHILAAVLDPGLLDAATLVFKTVRTGFPTANVRVWGNALRGRPAQVIQAAALEVGAQFTNLLPTQHDAWIEGLLQESLKPFWICDTDVVFSWPMEVWDWPVDTMMAGRFEKEFDEEWTGTRHMERLHPCVMWLNPSAVRTAIRQWMAQFPMPFRAMADFPLIRQHFVPLRGCRPLFYDTLAGLYQAAGGTPFDSKQNACFEHLHCATYAHLLTAPSLKDLAQAHRVIYQDPPLAMGLKGRQDEYYAERELVPLQDGSRVTLPLIPSLHPGTVHLTNEQIEEAN